MERWTAILAAVLVGACSSPASKAPPPGPAFAYEEPGGTGDAGAPRRSSTCPDDAPWNGKTCAGAGYVACPGDLRLEGDACILHTNGAEPARSATPPPPRSPRPERSGRVIVLEDLDASDSTGMPECDRFLRVYEHCLRTKLNQGPQATQLIDNLRQSYRTLSKDPKQRATVSAQCSTTLRGLRTTCP